MAVSLTWSTSVSYISDTAATISVTLKAKSTSGSYNKTSSSYGYIKIDGTKYGNFSHTFSANTTTTLGTKSHTVNRETYARSVSLYAWWHTDVSSGNITKSGSISVAGRPAYTVSFNGNGGTSSSVAVYAGYAATFPSTSRTGYNFTGWNGAYAAGSSTGAIWGNTGYTAYWSPITYTIGYNLNDGALNVGETNATTYTIESAEISLKKPVREGYHFTGWTGSNGTVPQGGYNTENLKIPRGSTGNRTYTANWEINKYKVTLDANNHNFPSNWEWPEGSDSTTNLVLKTHGVDLPLPDWGEGDNNITDGVYQLFAGWDYVEDLSAQNETLVATGTLYKRDGTTHEEVAVLRANWSDAVRSIILHYSDSNTTDNPTVVYQPFNRAINLSEKSIANYAFKGWALSRNGEVVYSMPNNMIVTDFDDWFFVTEDTIVQEDKAYYTKSGTETYTSVSLNPGDSISGTYYEMNNEPVSIELYAIWNRTYTVTYNINNPTYNDGITATGNVASIKVEDRIPFQLGSASSAYQYGNDRCLASGWSLDSGMNNGISTIGQTQLTDNAELTLTDLDPGYILNLYAVWTPQPVHVTLHQGYRQDGSIIAGTPEIITQNYFTTYTLPTEKLNGWRYETDLTVDDNYYISSWGSPTSTLKLGQSVTFTNDITYTANWLFAYYVPTVEDIQARRYVDSKYTVPNPGGKYIRVSATGRHGRYGDLSIDTHLYDVDVKFYASSDTTTAPIATYHLLLPNSEDIFYQTWGSPDRPIFDKRLYMVYCVLTITDETDYGHIIDREVRTFTYTFEVSLVRAIAMHVADDIHAISLFEELQEKDNGLVVNNDISIKRLWAWKIDPITQHMYLEWIGGSSDE